MKHMSVALLVTASILDAVGFARAEDRTIEFGSDPVTLSENTTYGRLVVNGDLTVGPNVALTVDTLCVATNISGEAKLTLEEGSSLVVQSTANQYVCLFGAAGGRVNYRQKSGSSFSCYHAMIDGQADFVISNATMTVNAGGKSGGKVVYGVTVGSDGRFDMRLDQDGVLTLTSLYSNPALASQFRFNGGRIRAVGNAGEGYFVTIPYRSSSAALSFVSVDANPIDIYLGAKHTSLMVGNAGSSLIAFTGSGDVVLEGEPVTTYYVVYPYKGGCQWRHSGKVVVRRSGLFLQAYDRFSDPSYSIPHDLVVENGGGVDLNGCPTTVRSLTVEKGGSFTNSSSTVAALTIDDGGSDQEWKTSLPANVTLTKRGAGTLSVFEESAPSMTVDEGGLRIVNRASCGYPFYKFNVYETGHLVSQKGGVVSGARLYLGELVYLDGEEDVTQGWANLYYVNPSTSYYNSPTYALDGDLATSFYDQRAYNVAVVSNIHFELEYALPRKITGYKWGMPSGMKSKDGNPVSWEVFGSLDNENWVSLDRVDYQAASWTTWTQRSVTFPTANYAITMAASTSLSVVGADVRAKVTAASDVLSLDGGAVALTSGTMVKALTTGATAGHGGTVSGFAAAENGLLNIVGEGTRCPKTLPVSLPGAADAVLSGWTVNYNGAAVAAVPVIKDGVLCCKSTLGLSVIIR